MKMQTVLNWIQVEVLVFLMLMNCNTNLSSKEVKFFIKENILKTPKEKRKKI